MKQPVIININQQKGVNYFVNLFLALLIKTKEYWYEKEIVGKRPSVSKIHKFNLNGLIT